MLLYVDLQNLSVVRTYVSSPNIDMVKGRQGNVRLSLYYIIKHYAMKAYGGVEV